MGSLRKMIKGCEAYGMDSSFENAKITPFLRYSYIRTLGYLEIISREGFIESFEKFDILSKYYQLIFEEVLLWLEFTSIDVTPNSVSEILANVVSRVKCNKYRTVNLA